MEQLLSLLKFLYNCVCKSASIVNLMSFPSFTILYASCSFSFPSESAIYILHPFSPFNSFSYTPSNPVFPMTLAFVYPSPACFSKSSAVTFCTYPTKCAASSFNGYSLTSTSEIITPDIFNNFSCRFCSSTIVSSGSSASKSSSFTFAIFLIGTNESSFTHFAVNSFSISSGFIPNNFAILTMDFFLFSNFPGIIPTDEATPFPASILPFLSRI